VCRRLTAAVVVTGLIVLSCGDDDQDSLAPADFIVSMLSDYASYPKQEHVALIAPLYRDRHTGLLLEDPCQGGSRALEIESAMTSGNLVKTSIFAEVGFFAEDFFIDYVDHEFCLRCNQRGYVILQSCRSVLAHSLGMIAIAC
jgi:rhamnosyltransferase